MRLPVRPEVRVWNGPLWTTHGCQSLPLSLSLAHLIFVGLLVFVCIVWACFLCMFLYILIIYIYMLSIKYLNSYYRYIDIILIFESNLQFVSVTNAFYHSSNPKFFCWTGKFKENHFLSVHKTLFSINNHTPHVVPFWSFRFGHFSENVEK